MAAIVGPEDDIAAAGQRVDIFLVALVGAVHERRDVAMVEDDDRPARGGLLAVGHGQQRPNPEPLGLVRRDVASIAIPWRQLLENLDLARRILLPAEVVDREGRDVDRGRDCEGVVSVPVSVRGGGAARPAGSGGMQSFAAELEVIGIGDGGVAVVNRSRRIGGGDDAFVGRRVAEIAVGQPSERVAGPHDDIAHTVRLRLGLCRVRVECAKEEHADSCQQAGESSGMHELSQTAHPPQTIVLYGSRGRRSGLITVASSSGVAVRSDVAPHELWVTHR